MSKRNYLIMLLLVTSLSFSAHSEMIVESINGSANDIRVTRNGSDIEIQRLSLLKNGDLIQITGSNTSLGLVNSNGDGVNLYKKDTPYKIKESNSTTWIDNAISAAIDWYGELEDVNTHAASMITRGSSVSPIVLRGFVLNTNKIPLDIDRLDFYWYGGTPPFMTRISDAHGKTLKNKETTSRSVTYSGLEGLSKELTFSVYSIEDTSNEKSQRIKIVSSGDLPESVKKVIKTNLPDDIKYSLVSIVLANSPGWEFAALQYAIHAEDSRIINELIN